MGLNRKVNSRTYCIANCGHNVDGKVFFPHGQCAPASPKWIKLEGRISQLDRLPRSLRKRLGRPRTTIPTVGIRSNSLVASASDQVVDGLIQCFPDGVPACDLQRRNGTHLDLAPVSIDM